MNRTQAIMKALGWQGGTIHQVAKETGCRDGDLLYAPLPTNRSLTSDYTSGWFAARTCSLEWNKERIFPKYKGNLDFWLGVASGLMVA